MSESSVIIRHLFIISFLVCCTVLSYAQPLQGTFVIGGSPSDYSNLYYAVYDLQLEGISGPVVFEIKDGVYDEYISIPQIIGSSTQNTVTFRSQSGNREDVIWKDDHSSNHNHTLRLMGADNIIVENLTLECFREHATDDEDSRVIMIQSNANNIIFRNNIIKSFNVGYQGNYQNHCIYVNSNTANQEFCDSISFINNMIIGGYGGLSFAGVSSPEEFGATNLTIRDNVFLDQSNRSIEVEAVRNCSITGNHIFSNENGFEGMWVNFISDSMQFDRNYVHLARGGKAIRLENFNADGMDALVVSNNVIAVGEDPTGGQSIGFSTLGNDSILIVHNSVNIYNENNVGYALYSIGADTLFLLNNQFRTTDVGHCYFSDQAAPTFVQNYNNIYSGAAPLASFASVDHDLSVLQSNFSFELNSTSTDPMFFSDTLLLPTVSATNNTGLPLANVSTDFFENPRSATTPDVGAYENQTGLVDAGIQIASVIADTLCADEVIPLYVNVVNTGSVPLTSATLGYGTQDSVYASVNWVGNLNQYESESSIYLGDLLVSDLEFGNLSFWSADPNGITDQWTFNDTMGIQTHIRMNGVYTIGDSLSDFPNISSAAEALMAKGICGPVVFNVADGIYTDRIHMGAIDGSSEINTITFQSASLDSSAVEIRSSPSYYAQYLWRFVGTDNLIIRNLTFHTLGNTPYHTLSLTYDVSNIQILGNRFISGENTSYSYIYASSASPVNLVIRNNLFQDGGSAITLNSTEEVEIIGNVFDGEHRVCVNMNYCSNITISDNQMIGHVYYNNNVGNGISLTYCNSPIIIERNNIVNNGHYNYQVYLDDCVGTAQNPIMIRNNFIGHSYDAQSTKGLRIRSGTEHVKVLHNTFRSISCITIENWVSDISILNNIIYSPTPSQLYNVWDPEPSLSNIAIDYNCLFNPDSIWAYFNQEEQTFAEWMLNSGFDQHSFITEPLFVDSGDLHILNQNNLNGTAIPLPEVTEDIDGELRDLSFPDVGADEYDIDSTSYYDIELVKVISPDTSSCDAVDSIIVQVAGHSSFPITSFTVKWWLFGILNDSTVHNVTIAPYDTVEINLGNFSFTPNTLYRLDFELSLPNGEFDNHFSDNEAQIDFSHLDNVVIHQFKDSLCTNQVELYITNFPRESVLWSTGSTANRIFVNSAGTYAVTVEDSDGCVVTDTEIVD